MIRDIEPIWGSHSDLLARELSMLEPGALVLEHGAGLYSTPLIAASGADVIVVESLAGWRAWSQWLYERHTKAPRYLEHAKRAIPMLGDLSIAFIDGVDRERGDLLRWCLDAGVPVVIAHDTQDETRKQYNYQPHAYIRANYTIEHDGSAPRTTVWKRCG